MDQRHQGQLHATGDAKENKEKARHLVLLARAQCISTAHCSPPPTSADQVPRWPVPRPELPSIGDEGVQWLACPVALHCPSSPTPRSSPLPASPALQPLCLGSGGQADGHVRQAGCQRGQRLQLQAGAGTHMSRESQPVLYSRTASSSRASHTALCATSNEPSR